MIPCTIHQRNVKSVKGFSSHRTEFLLLTGTKEDSVPLAAASRGWQAHPGRGLPLRGSSTLSDSGRKSGNGKQMNVGNGQEQKINLAMESCVLKGARKDSLNHIDSHTRSTMENILKRCASVIHVTILHAVTRTICGLALALKTMKTRLGRVGSQTTTGKTILKRSSHGKIAMKSKDWSNQEKLKLKSQNYLALLKHMSAGFSLENLGYAKLYSIDI